MTEGCGRQSATLRYEWMDMLRGIAILLVVVWHSIAIPALFDLGMPPVIRSINDFFLPFRMPTLMFCRDSCSPSRWPRGHVPTT